MAKKIKGTDVQIFLARPDEGSPLDAETNLLAIQRLPEEIRDDPAVKRAVTVIQNKIKDHVVEDET